MSGGDTLIIKDGAYAGTANRIYDIPSGMPSQYTTIRAEHDWGVTLSGTGNGAYSPPIEIKTNYIVVRGFKIKNNSDSHVNVSGDYVKIIRCASDGISEGPGSSFAADGNYILFEECYSWGAGRYPMRTANKGAQYVIFRRCVCRWDYSNTDEPQACFGNYDSPNVYFQNCIAIDGKDIRAQDIEYDGLMGFFTPNGANETHYTGCISLNMEGGGYNIEDHPVTNVTLTNCVAWDCIDTRYPSTYSDIYNSYLLYVRPDEDGGPITITHCNFGVSDHGKGLQIRTVPNNMLKNSIIYGVTLAAGEYALNGGTEDYNSFYNNTGGRNRSGGVGAHSIANINPKTNSLKYLPRIEANSDLSNKADDGGAIGANILKKIGVSGTLYGESGWNTVTNENLWPFPNEDEIKKDMASFYKAPNEAYAGSPEMIGKRGFVADGNGLYGGPITLTSYIWEYLGNPCPPEICSYGTTPPPTPPNLTLTLQADKTEVQSGDILTYTLTYRNTASGSARNVVITNPLPQGAAYVAGSATGGGVYDAGSGRITWTIPTLAGNATGAVSFQATVE